MELLARKKAGDELDYEPRINPINEYLEDRIGYFERAVAETVTAAGGPNREGTLSAAAHRMVVRVEGVRYNESISPYAMCSLVYNKKSIN